MTVDIKQKLKNEVWRSDIYYQLAKKGSSDINHPGMQTLLNLAKSSKMVLDLGCGEGTRLNKIISNSNVATGIDISKVAINLAKRTYPEIKFLVADLENIPLSSDTFNLVYSAYVLEHLSNPHKMLLEAIRLTKKEGQIVLIAPNYGAPNRCSPPFKGSRSKKLIKGFINDFSLLFTRDKDINWEKVMPISSKLKYDIDWDTTTEPYISSLILFLKSKGLKVKYFTTCWKEELKGAKLHQKVFRLLGKIGIYPFTRWGPHLVVVAKKIT